MSNKLIWLGEQLALTFVYAFVGYLAQEASTHILALPDLHGGLAAGIAAFLGKVTKVSIFSAK